MIMDVSAGPKYGIVVVDALVHLMLYFILGFLPPVLPTVLSVTHTYIQ